MCHDEGTVECNIRTQSRGWSTREVAIEGQLDRRLLVVNCDLQVVENHSPRAWNDLLHHCFLPSEQLVQHTALAARPTEVLVEDRSLCRLQAPSIWWSRIGLGFLHQACATCDTRYCLDIVRVS